MTDETRQSPSQTVSHADPDHRAECDCFMKDGSVRRAFVTIIEPGKIPDGKGPFLTLEHLDRFLGAAMERHTDPATHIIIHELTWNDELWTQCARERAEIDAAMDGVDFEQLTSSHRPEDT
jgi:hypothetical protein